MELPDLIRRYYESKTLENLQAVNVEITRIVFDMNPHFHISITSIDDIAQDTALKCMPLLADEELRPETSKAFVKIVANSKMADAANKWKTWDKHKEKVGEKLSRDKECLETLNKEGIEQLLRAIHRLSNTSKKPYQSVICMILEGKKGVGIAKTLGVAKQRVSEIKQEAVKMLGHMLRGDF